MEIGTTVQLKKAVKHTCPKGRENNRTAKIKAFLEVEGGVMLDRDLRGCLYWNVEDLEVVSA